MIQFLHAESENKDQTARMSESMLFHVGVNLSLIVASDSIAL